MNFVPDIGFLMQSQAQSWHLYLLLSLFVAYAITRTILGGLSNSTLMAALRYSNAVSMYNNNSQLQKQRDLVLNVFYVISMGFFAMFVLTEYGLKPYNIGEYKLLLFVSGILLGFIVSICFYTFVPLK
jgi:polyferredoxin